MKKSIYLITLVFLSLVSKAQFATAEKAVTNYSKQNKVSIKNPQYYYNKSGSSEVYTIYNQIINPKSASTIAVINFKDQNGKVKLYSLTSELKNKGILYTLLEGRRPVGTYQIALEIPEDDNLTCEEANEAADRIIAEKQQIANRDCITGIICVPYCMGEQGPPSMAQFEIKPTNFRCFGFPERDMFFNIKDLLFTRSIHVIMDDVIEGFSVELAKSIVK